MTDTIKVIVIAAGVIGVLLLALAGAVIQWIEVKGDLRTAKTAKEQAEGAARINQDSLTLCRLTNKNNEMDAALQRARAEAALVTLVQEEIKTKQKMEELERESKDFKIDGLACPALTPEFRRWVQGD